MDATQTRLDGRVIVITGAASGIGRALAEGFRADGATVVGGDLERSIADASSVCHHAIACDVRSPEDNEALVEFALQQTGRLDCFIANAGIGIGGNIEDQSFEHFQRVIQVNLEGVFLGFRSALRPMRAAGTGRLIAVASRNAEICQGSTGAYNASKAGVIALVRTLSRELKGTDIIVNNLIPGVSATGIWGSSDSTPAEARDPSFAYPTARMLATLPPGSPSGRTFFDGEQWPIYERFSR